MPLPRAVSTAASVSMLHVTQMRLKAECSDMGAGSTLRSCLEIRLYTMYMENHIAIWQGSVNVFSGSGRCSMKQNLFRHMARKGSFSASFCAARSKGGGRRRRRVRKRNARERDHTHAFGQARGKGGGGGVTSEALPGAL